MTYCPPPTTGNNCEDLRLEYVTCSVGCDDWLDLSLPLNRPHVDTAIVVTSHNDTKTHAVARKHGAICVVTDLWKKNQRNFNKGAAINMGMSRYQYRGWRMHLDADIVLPDAFRHLLFNHTHLDTEAIYGADRVNAVGVEDVMRLKVMGLQHQHRCLVESGVERKEGARYVDTLNGYLPLGYFQLWHASQQKEYPWSLGDASHDDIMFAATWPRHKRFVLASAIVYHLCARTPQWSENWDGHRKQPRLPGLAKMWGDVQKPKGK